MEKILSVTFILKCINILPTKYLQLILPLLRVAFSNKYNLQDKLIKQIIFYQNWMHKIISFFSFIYYILFI